MPAIGSIGGFSAPMASAVPFGQAGTARAVPCPDVPRAVSVPTSSLSAQEASSGRLLDHSRNDLAAIALLAVLATDKHHRHQAPSALGAMLAAVAIRSFESVQSLGGPQGVMPAATTANVGFSAKA